MHSVLHCGSELVSRMPRIAASVERVKAILLNKALCCPGLRVASSRTACADAQSFSVVSAVASQTLHSDPLPDPVSFLASEIMTRTVGALSRASFCGPERPHHTISGGWFRRYHHLTGLYENLRRQDVLSV